MATPACCTRSIRALAVGGRVSARQLAGRHDRHLASDGADVWLGGRARFARSPAARVAGGLRSHSLACAYGFIEEGLVTQSLFNPNYLGLRLLDFGFIPALGTALPWLIYVISIHVVWSICVPIGLAESLFPAKRDQPWLGPIGIGVFSLLLVAGCA